MKKDIISISDLTKNEIENILSQASEFEKLLGQKKVLDLLKGKILATLFFEPSTRTKLSFETAMEKMGGSVIGSGFVPAQSSLIKGESLRDTIKVVEGYADCIVIRHPLEGSARFVSEITSIPVINAGDGANQHPTQTLIDLYTIKKEFGKIDGLKIALVGDLKYGRTVHSLATALDHYSVSLKFISHPTLKMPEAFKNNFKNSWAETEELDVKDCDIIYATRIQKERFPDPIEYERVKGLYKIDESVMGRTNAILLHPLPIVDEIAPELDKNPKSRYFQQAHNGVFVRMAILNFVLS